MQASKPRITFSLTSNQMLEISVNEKGRELLARAIAALSEHSDHVHFSPDGDVGLPCATRPYRTDDTILEWVKICFRPDSWDKAEFPHVL